MVGERALPDVAAVALAVDQPVTPREALLIEAAPRGVLPLGLAREAATGPASEGGRVVPRHVDDGVVAAIVEVGARSEGVTPVGSRHHAPPRRGGHGAGRWVVSGQEALEHERPAEALSLSNVAGVGDELSEAVIGDSAAIDAEGSDLDLPYRPLAIGWERAVVAAHAKATAGSATIAAVALESATVVAAVRSTVPATSTRRSGRLASRPSAVPPARAPTSPRPTRFAPRPGAQQLLPVSPARSEGRIAPLDTYYHPTWPDEPPKVVCVGLSTLDHLWRVERFPPTGSRTPARAYDSSGGGPAATAA